MTKSIKNLFVAFLATVALISFALTGGAFGAKADVEVPAAPAGTAEVVAEKIAELESFEVLGTQVRTVDPLGMRFISVISDADLAKLPTNAMFGTLIIPSDLLDGELTLDTELVANVVARVGYNGKEVAEGYKGYTGVIIGNEDDYNFPIEDFTRDFTAVGYVTYAYGNGNFDTIYTAPVTTDLVEVADAVLNEVGADDNELLAEIVGMFLSDVTISVDVTELKTGESTDLIVNGMPDSNLAIEVVENEFVGFDASTGKVYGKKVGTGKVELKVTSINATASTQEITVSAIEAGKADSVEFLVDDNAIDFSSAVASNSALASALASNGDAKLDGVAVSVADNKVTLAKPELDTDAIYGDKARVLTITSGDIEYTVNFSSIVAGYIVDSKAELDNVNTVTKISDTSWAGYVMLNADIDYEYGTFAGIAPLKSSIHPNDIENIHVQTGFKGVFDGNGHYIDNMTIGDNSSRNVGFFGSLAYGAVVKNVAFLDVKLLYSTASEYQAAGVIAAISFASTITEVLVVAEVKDICGKTWTANEGFAWSGKLGIALGHKSNPSTFTNCVFINNVNSLRESLYPGADNNIYSTKTGVYNNVLGIFFAASGKPNGMTNGHHSMFLHDHSTQGLLKNVLDVSKLNQDVWGMQKANLQMSGYELLGNIIFFNGNALKAVDTWNLTYPPIVNK